MRTTVSLSRGCSFGLRLARTVGFAAVFVAVSPFFVAGSARAASDNATPPANSTEGESTSSPALPSSPNAGGLSVAPAQNGSAKPAPPSLPRAPGGAAADSVLVDNGAGVRRAIDFPDPFVLRPSSAGSPWYAYATGSGFVDLQVISSNDGVNWTWGGDPLPGGRNLWADLFGWSWAPSVIERPANPGAQRFVMYYVAHDRASGMQCIGRATSASAAGPFADERTSPLICQTGSGGSIDPSPFVAADGTLWLVYSDVNPTTSIWSVQLTSDGLSVASGASQLLTTASATWEDPRVEGPSMVSTPSGVLLFYSANVYYVRGYSVGVARCDGPTGPCSRIYSTAVLATRSSMAGPGGESVFQDAAGNWQVTFHAWTNPKVGYESGGARTLRFLPLTFPNGLPKIG
jgi:beta-xylosidase